MSFTKIKKRKKKREEKISRCVQQGHKGYIHAKDVKTTKKKKKNRCIRSLADKNGNKHGEMEEKGKERKEKKKNQSSFDCEVTKRLSSIPSLSTPSTPITLPIAYVLSQHFTAASLCLRRMRDIPLKSSSMLLPQRKRRMLAMVSGLRTSLRDRCLHSIHTIPINIMESTPMLI